MLHVHHINFRFNEDCRIDGRRFEHIIETFEMNENMRKSQSKIWIGDLHKTILVANGFGWKKNS